MVVDVVTLNVGGVHYCTTIQTLIAHEHSMLGAMFSTRNRDLLQQDGQGRYFVDRDGKLFRYILNYLRNGSIAKDSAYMSNRYQIRQEAEFFSLKGLVEELDGLEKEIETQDANNRRKDRSESLSSQYSTFSSVESVDMNAANETLIDQSWFSGDADF